jgi:thiol-disulfide isomerase/thioredoxin
MHACQGKKKSMFGFKRSRAVERSRPAQELLAAVTAASALLPVGHAVAAPAMQSAPQSAPADGGLYQTLPALDLAAHAGKVIYVDFWASWCAPCRRSFPWMQATQRELASRGLVVLTVNVDEDPRQAERFLQEVGGGLPVVFDSKGQLAELYKLQGMPSSFVVDRHGSIRFRHRGFRTTDPEAYTAELRQLLDET